MGKSILQNLNFELRRGETWAIISPSSEEQTAFLQTIRGKTILREGQISFPFAEKYLGKMNELGIAHSPQDLISHVSQEYQFRNKSNLQNFYFQQRFNSSEVNEALTVKEYLVSNASNQDGFWTLGKVSTLLNLVDLLDQSILKLSNGETRRLALALGLLRQPLIFLMDQPTTGLDVQSRMKFGVFLEEITTAGVHVILTCSPEEIPSGVTHVGKLLKDGFEALKIQEFNKLEQEGTNFPFDQDELISLSKAEVNDSDQLIRLLNVNIKYANKQILKDLSWEVKSGEQWQIKGKNGSGKSTLISLLIGENPQAYANDIWLFGRKRGSGESIWDIKRPTGFVAPELARFFPANQTCRKVILSGFFDTMGLFKKVNEQQENLADRWIKLFALKAVSNVPIQRLAADQQRWTLLARALIKRPKLLILDEASQGLDNRQRYIFKETIDAICRESDLTLIYVSHYDSDVPQAVDRVLDLNFTEVNLIP